jgi:hypothetical protein
MEKTYDGWISCLQMLRKLERSCFAIGGSEHRGAWSRNYFSVTSGNDRYAWACAVDSCGTTWLNLSTWPRIAFIPELLCKYSWWLVLLAEVETQTVHPLKNTNTQKTMGLLTSAPWKEVSPPKLTEILSTIFFIDS